MTSATEKTLPPKRYREGLVVVAEDSRAYAGDSEKDYVIKRLYVRAEHFDKNDWELVAYLEVEVFDTTESEEDAGVFDPRGDIYRVPFPFDSKLRKAIVRLMRTRPKLFLA